MAFKPAEAWISENQTMVAIKTKGGGYQYYVTTTLAVGGHRVDEQPVVAVEITKLNLEMVDAKTSNT